MSKLESNYCSALRIASNAPAASLSHRVHAGLILLKLGTNMGDADLMHWVYGFLSPLIAEKWLGRSCSQPDIRINLSRYLRQIGNKYFHRPSVIGLCENALQWRSFGTFSN